MVFHGYFGNFQHKFLLKYIYEAMVTVYNSILLFVIDQVRFFIHKDETNAN